MNIFSVYEIVGLIITFIAAAITYFTSPNKKADLLLVTVLGGVLTILVGLRFDAVPKLRDQHALGHKVQDHKEVKNLVDKLVKANKVATDSEEVMVKELLRIRFENLTSFLDNFERRQFDITENDLPRFCLELARTAKESFHASSYVRMDEWWNKPWGEEYEMLNIAAVKRGVQVSRTFIFSKPETLDRDTWHSLIDHMKTEYRGKIEVRVVKSSDLIDDLTSDMVVVDDRIAGELELTPDKSFKKATFYTNESQVRRIKNNLQNLRVNSREFSVDDNGELTGLPWSRSR